MRIGALILCFFITAACDRTQSFRDSRRQVKGQVFVVTEGASNLRLGDIPVSFYSDAQVNEFQTQAQRKRMSDQQALSRLMQQLQNNEAEEERQKSEIAKLEELARRADGEITQEMIEYANEFAAAQNHLISLEETKGWPQTHGLEDWISSILGIRGEWNDRSAIAALQKQYMPFTSVDSASAYIAKSAAIMDYETVTSEKLGIYPFSHDAPPEIGAAFKDYAKRSREIRNTFDNHLQTLRVNRADLAHEQEIKKRFITEKIAQVQNTEREQQASIAQIRNNAPVAFDVSALPAPLLTIRTDANGEFTCEVPQEATVLHATGTRKLPTGDNEFYTWLLRLPSRLPLHGVVLSNSNLLSADFKKTGTIAELQ